MKINQLNVTVREILVHLINDGYGKKALCDATLGAQAYPQFDRFIKGTDLGIKPLERVLEGLGYDTLTIPVKKDDQNAFNTITSITNGFVEDVRTDLITYLENRPIPERGIKGGGKVNAAIGNEVNKIKEFIDSI